MVSISGNATGNLYSCCYICQGIAVFDCATSTSGNTAYIRIFPRHISPEGTTQNLRFSICITHNAAYIVESFYFPCDIAVFDSCVLRIAE